MKPLGGGWDELLAPLFNDEKYKKIREFLKQEYSTRIIYPDMYDLFNCFRFTPVTKIKAVILGQDPYHEPNQAHGLCFSVKKGVKLPPSLHRFEYKGTCLRRFDQMGGERSSAVEYHTYRTRTYGKFALDLRLGVVYGQRYKDYFG